MTASSQRVHKQLAVNRRALHDYHVLQRHEAGIQLAGTEVKSIRAGQASLVGGHARVERGELFLFDVSIPPYEHGNRFNHETLRVRRLLMHAREIKRLEAETDQKGNALIPLSLYLRGGLIKIELGLCKGKRQYDKRADLKRREADREADRAVRR